MLPAIFFIFRWTLPLSPIQFVNQLCHVISYYIICITITVSQIFACGGAPGFV